jgi:hypothetical protein
MILLRELAFGLRGAGFHATRFFAAAFGAALIMPRYEYASEKVCDRIYPSKISKMDFA